MSAVINIVHMLHVLTEEGNAEWDNFINTVLKTGFYFHNEVVKFQLTVCKHIRKQ